MKLYTCTKFTGLYPVGVAAVVFADNREDAAETLNRELRLRNLQGDAKPEGMELMLRNTGVCRILNDGNY